MGTTITLSSQIIILLLIVLSSPTQSQPITYNFAGFNSSNIDNFKLSDDTGISQGALQVTPDTMNNKLDFLVNKSGRILLPRPFNLWQPVPTTLPSPKTTLASFNTSFTVNIYRVDGTVPGEGFSFIIAPSLDGPPPNSYGQYLGLTNATVDGSPTNHIVAVELDTVKQAFDPDDNHIGLNINSVRSEVSNSLTPLGMQIAPVNSTNYTVWIEYDGGARRIRAYIAPQGQARETVLVAALDLSKYVLQDSYFGFAASTGVDYQLNCVLAWNLSVESLPDRGGGDGGMKAWKWAVFIGAPGAVSAGVLVAVMWFVWWRRRRVGDDPNALAGTLKSLPGTPREFEFKVLRRATNNFDERMKLGQGGFGVVYKGVIHGENVEVAVKKFSRENLKGQVDFLAELTIINRLRHKHLVRLLGWCHKNGTLLLVYEYMPNGSLDHHIFSGPNRPILTWNRRHNVLAGVASALHYLHNEYDEKVVHRDLKASNILLDSNFNARLGDFGLARVLESDKTSYVDVELGGVPGTLGYIAPECFHTGKATRESDVFAFGAVVLEVVCGVRPRCDISGLQFLADWVWKLHREGRVLDAVDPRLGEEFVEDDAARLLLLGLACSHPNPKERPKTAAVVQIVSGSVNPPDVPPFKPAFVWPSGPHEEDEDIESVASTAMNSPFYGSSTGCTPRGSETFSCSNR